MEGGRRGILNDVLNTHSKAQPLLTINADEKCKAFTLGDVTGARAGAANERGDKNTSTRGVWGTIQLKQKHETPSHSHGVKTVSACSVRFKAEQNRLFC